MLGLEVEERVVLWLGLIDPDTVEHIVGDPEVEGDDVTEWEVVPVILPEAEEEEDTLTDPLSLPLTVFVTVPETEKLPLPVVLCDALPLGLMDPDTEEHPELVTDGQDVGDTDELIEGL